MLLYVSSLVLLTLLYVCSLVLLTLLYVCPRCSSVVRASHNRGMYVCTCIDMTYICILYRYDIYMYIALVRNTDTGRGSGVHAAVCVS